MRPSAGGAAGTQRGESGMGAHWPWRRPREAWDWVAGGGGVARRPGLRRPRAQRALGRRGWRPGLGGRAQARGARVKLHRTCKKNSPFQSGLEPCSGRSAPGSPPRQSGVSGLGRPGDRRRAGHKEPEGESAHVCGSQTQAIPSGFWARMWEPQGQTAGPPGKFRILALPSLLSAESPFAWMEGSSLPWSDFPGGVPARGCSSLQS